MTSINEIDPFPLKMYPQTKNAFESYRITDRQTNIQTRQMPSSPKNNTTPFGVA